MLKDLKPFCKLQDGFFYFFEEIFFLARNFEGIVCSCRLTMYKFFVS